MPKKPKIEFRYYMMPMDRYILAVLEDDGPGAGTGSAGAVPDSLHFHNYLEIGYCHAGSGRMVLGGKTHPYAAGSCTFIPKNCPHRTDSDPGVRSRWEYLFVDEEDLLKEFCRGLKPRRIGRIIRRLQSAVEIRHAAGVCGSQGSAGGGSEAETAGAPEPPGVADAACGSGAAETSVPSGAAAFVGRAGDTGAAGVSKEAGNARGSEAAGTCGLPRTARAGCGSEAAETSVPSEAVAAAGRVGGAGGYGVSGSAGAACGSGAPEAARLAGKVLEILEIMRGRKEHYIEEAQGCMVALLIGLSRERGDFEDAAEQLPGADRRGAGADVSPVAAYALDYISAHYMEELNMDELAGSCHLSQVHFRRIFYACMNMTPVEYLNRVRIYNACEYLEKTDRPVADIARRCGFSTPSTFHRNFVRLMGMTPREWRKRPENFERLRRQYEIMFREG